MSRVGHQLLAFSIAFLSGTSGPSTEYPFVVVLMGVLLRSGLVDVRSLLVGEGWAQHCLGLPVLARHSLVWLCGSTGCSSLFKQVCSSW